MLLGTKIVTIAVGSVFVTATAGMLIQGSVVRKQGIELTRDTMRTTILGAENTRRSVSNMRSARMFDDARLLAEMTGVSDYRQTNLYKTVPVVAAWDSIAEVAKKQDYEFRVAANNPRNAKNAPRPEEARILSQMEANRLEEYFEVDEKANEILYARPIVLSQDCMVCHGDPATSPSKNGKDVLGIAMEGWRAGDRHGMFLLRSKLDRVDAVARAGMARTAMWVVPLTLAIGIGVYFLISRISGRLQDLIRQVSGGALEVAGAVAQIASASQAVADGATRQSASLEETSAASEQITSMTRKNAEHSRTAAAEMETVDQQVRAGNAAIGEMAASMGNIKGSSDKISRIIKVIDGIAFQTNILALNAAVEAARAGSAGAGFAVVADEVRNLAQRSAQAAKDTAPLIEDSILKAEEGSVKLRQVMDAIGAITVSSRRVRSLVDEVKSGSQEQERGIEQVAKALSQMDRITQGGAASAEEMAASCMEMAAQAESMSQTAEELRLVVEG